MIPTTYITEAKLPTTQVAVGNLRFTSFTTFYNQDLLIVTNCNPIFLYSNASRSWYRKLRHIKPVTSTHSKLFSYSRVGSYSKMKLVVKRVLTARRSRKYESQNASNVADLVRSKRFCLAFAVLSESDEILLKHLLATLKSQSNSTPILLEIFTQKPVSQVDKSLVGSNVDNLRIIQVINKGH